MSPYDERLPKGSVRLLQLLPHQDQNSRIECRLITCFMLDLGRTHPYEALSYVWGSEKNKLSIYIDGVEQPVRANLHHALSHLRDCFVERVLWIDAICINQDGNEEKGQQVQSMAKIYAKASRVIMWLVDPLKDAPDKDDLAAGDQVDNGDQALEAIRAAAEERRVDPTMDQKMILTLLGRGWFQRSGFPLNIRPLGELVDMYHTRLSNTVFVSTWDAKEVAVIEAKGYVGKVSSAGDNMEITWKTAPGHSDAKGEPSSPFTFQASAKAIK
ncbi:hypothetical protein GGTG_13570 [Gaeumannomyces tritici R3-111a-1]|uniref:Heterokaryon incompatibility domain-containing protein n=1 Tax=Gaeumannomyces tritici (strain R3-111a-1) TaxID=644352 RepID=J3PJ89_GAET3|nr:hypothetical protein GGTG_13570 [Gaeumannomyces tritici R3-111a-1]EJT68861.1 hypothetical protein GGTG_13570 [Gaeumannomyces tritici R3-111a-1]